MAEHDWWQRVRHLLLTPAAEIETAPARRRARLLSALLLLTILSGVLFLILSLFVLVLLVEDLQLRHLSFILGFLTTVAMLVLISAFIRQDYEERLQWELEARVEAEQALRHLNQELESRVRARTGQLRERTEELATAKAQLEELDRLKSKFIADTSHELRTPVANLGLYLSLLRRGGPERQEQYLEVLDAQFSRLTRLVENIMTISALDVAQAEMTVTRFDLNALVRQVAAPYQQRAARSGLRLELALTGDLPRVAADIDQMEKVIAHLVANAFQHSERGEILIRTYYDRCDDAAGVIVADTGPGILPEEQPYLFDRFYRGKQVGQLSVSGSGLGLAIVKESVELHGGEVGIHSLPGEGAVFAFWLPLAAA